MSADFAHELTAHEYGEAPVDLLRRAAGLMRKRAEAATPGAWEAFGSAVEVGCFSVGVDGGAVVADPVVPVDAEHIASWHPDVALAVADWLDHEALLEEECRRQGAILPPEARRARSLTVARAYLGSDDA